MDKRNSFEKSKNRDPLKDRALCHQGTTQLAKVRMVNPTKAEKSLKILQIALRDKKQI